MTTKNLKEQQLINELQMLRVNFAQAIDEQKWEMFDDILDEQVTVDYTDFGIPVSTMSKSDVVNIIKNTLKQNVKTMHFLTNFNLNEIDSTTISGIVNVFARHHSTNVENGSTFDVTAKYVDTYSKTNSGWRIKSFKLAVSWTEGNVTDVFNM
jgi:3-phenylpropionate/cinnamic acid dioxygenase small subunit